MKLKILKLIFLKNLYVAQFKNDLKENLIFANTITKIKPFISESWIKNIESY